MNKGNKKYISIEIRNEEPLKIGASGSKKNTQEPSKDFIPGSTIRGAIIAQLLRHKKIEVDHLNYILQSMQCYNAYPYRDSLFIPIPRHLRVDKHEWRKMKMMQESGHNDENSKPNNKNGTNNLSIALNDLLQQKQDNLDHKLSEGHHSEDEAISKKQTPTFSFITLSGDKLQGLNVKKMYNQHHSLSLNKDRKEKSNLFSYQAIEAGYTFRSLIAVPESEVKLIEEILSSSEQWYLGGSKGSGYGRSHVHIIAVSEDYNQALKQIGLSYSYKDNAYTPSILTITCLSNVLFRDEYGQPMPHLSPQSLSQQLGQAVEFEQAITQVALSEGYNSKWRARYPKEAVIEAGSVFTYKLDEPITTQQIQQLEQNLSGFRTEEGYGWLGVNINYPKAIFLAEVDGKVQSKPRVDIVDQDTDKAKDNNKVTDKFKVTVSEVAGDPSFKIIQAGLRSGEMKQRWLTSIIVNSINQNEIIVGDNLSSHYTNMNEYIKNSGKTNLSKAQEKYMIDKDKFSISGANFIEIIQFLNTDKTSNYPSLVQFAQKKLNTTKGNLFYGQLTNREQAQQFIRDYVTCVLKMCVRRAKYA